MKMNIGMSPGFPSNSLIAALLPRIDVARGMRDAGRRS